MLANDTNKNLWKILSIVAMVILFITALMETFSYFQVNNLQSPLLPAEFTHELMKQYLFKALFAGFALLLAIAAFAYKKYLWSVVIVLVSIIAARFIYV